jgi:hypothetical protein
VGMTRIALLPTPFRDETSLSSLSHLSLTHSLRPSGATSLLLLTFQELVDGVELSGPPGVVEEWTEVESVVIWRVVLGVIGWRECGALVSVD